MADEKMQFAMPMAVERSAVLKAKAEKEKEAAILKAKAEAEKEESIIKAKTEAAKEERIIKVNCCASDEDDVPYDKLWHDSDTEEDPDIIMARIVERWDLFMKEEEARFPDQTYRVYYPREYTVDDQEGSDDEQYYHRLLDEGLLV